MQNATTRQSPEERDFPLGVPGFTYQDLHRDTRLADLDRTFLEELGRDTPALAARLKAYRADPASLDPLSRSRLLVEAARPLSAFVVRLFGIEAEWRAQAASSGPEAVLFRFRRDFLLRRAVKTKLPEDLAGMDLAPLSAAASALETGLHPELPWQTDAELATSQMVAGLLDLEADFIAALRQKKKPEVSPAAREGAVALARRAAATATAPRAASEADADLLVFLEKLLEQYALWCHLRREHPALKPGIRGWISFKLPETLDYQNLVETERPNPAIPEERVGPAAGRRRRDGFKLTDPRMTPREVLSEMHYCVLCHERDKDSCSKGSSTTRTATMAEEPARHRARRLPARREDLRDARAAARAATPSARSRWSCVDNPMCPGTGHRICNDCMKSCIYQKQEPVNIPQIETGVLTDVLQLPWGVEIYGAADALEPAQRRAGRIALPYNGKNVLVVGLGPAGYTLAHYLRERRLRRRRHRRAEDRAAARGPRRRPTTSAPRPIRDWSEIYRAARRARARRLRRRLRVRHHRALGQELPDAPPPDARAPARGFAMYGGVRFGGTLPIEDAWTHGLRPRRDRRRRRQADDHRHEEQPDPRHPQGVRLPDGAAADRRVQARTRCRTCRRGCRRSSSAAA